MSFDVEGDRIFMPTRREVPVGDAFDAALPCPRKWPLTSPLFINSDNEFFTKSFELAVPNVPNVLDFEGRVVDVTACALHSERPDPERLCMNGLVGGMPKPCIKWMPLIWTWDFTECEDVIEIAYVSAWADERCLAILGQGPTYIHQGTFNVQWGSGGSKLEPLPMPSRYQRPEHVQ